MVVEPSESVSISDAMSVLLEREGHIEISVEPGALASLFNGKLVISPHDPFRRKCESEDAEKPEWKKNGLISLADCAEYLTAKFSHEFTEKELLEWADSGYLPHVRIKGKGVSVYRTKVASWVSEQFVETCEGKPFPWGLHPVYLEDEKPNVSPPTCLLAIYEKLLFLSVTKYPPCVYFLVSGSDVVYVGQSINLLSRIGQHGDKVFDCVFFLPIPASRLNEVEQAFIRTLRPKYNGTYANQTETDYDKSVIESLSKIDVPL